MSFNDNSSKLSANSSAQISDQMLVLRTNAERAIQEDMSLLKPTIDLAQLGIKSLSDYKKFDKIVINKAMIDSTMDENIKRLDRLNQTKDNASHENDKANELDVGSAALVNSTDYLNKCGPSFKHMANKFAQKSKNNYVRDNENSERKVIDIDNRRVEQLVTNAEQLRRLQHSQTFLKSFPYK